MTQITKVIGRVQLRGGTTNDATSKNETLLDRELFIEKGKGIKVGDGVTPYNGLNYAVDFNKVTDLTAIGDYINLHNSDATAHMDIRNLINGLEGGGNIEGTNYIFVQANSTPEENYQEFVNAYNTLKARFPNPYATPENYGIILAPGTYTGSNLLINHNKINIISLTGEPDVIFTNRINFSALSIKVKGIKSTYNDESGYGGSFYTNNNNHNNMVFINCVGGNGSFYSHQNGNKYINCVGGKQSFNTSGMKREDNYYKDCEAKGTDGFKSEQILYGTFENCIAGNFGFIGESKIQAIFTNCQAGDNSFFSDGDTLNSGFINCIAGGDSFIGQETISHSTFKNCKAGNGSFKTRDGGGITDTLFENCSAGNNSFWSEDNFKAEFRNCVAGNSSFVGNNNEIEETSLFYNCKAGNNSFKATVDNNKGRFYNCIAGNSSFQGKMITGFFKDCIAGTNSFITLPEGVGGNIAGTFINCVADRESFGASSAIQANSLFLNCKGGENCFGYSSIRQEGDFINCVAEGESFGANSDDNNPTANYKYCIDGPMTGIADTTGVKLFCIANNQGII